MSRARSSDRKARSRTILRATVRAVPRPKEVGLAVLGFDDVFIAADQMRWLLAHRPEALEGFDEKLPEFARIKKMPGMRFLPAGHAFLLAELGGASRDEARERAERMIAQARALRECTGAAYIADAREQAAVWQIRESGLGSSAYIPGRPRSWPGAEDSAVPPANLGAFLRRFDRILAQPQPQGRDLLRTLRRRMRSRAHQFRFGERAGNRDVPRHDGGARRAGRESRRFALR